MRQAGSSSLLCKDTHVHTAPVRACCVSQFYTGSTGLLGFTCIVSHGECRDQMLLFMSCISLATSPGRAGTGCAEGHCLRGVAGVTPARGSPRRPAQPAGLHTSATGEGKFSASTSHMPNFFFQ